MWIQIYLCKFPNAVPELKVLNKCYVKLINVLKVQGDNLFQHFISVEIVTLEDYNDCDEVSGSRRSKAKWFVGKISGHLEAGYCASFYKMLEIMKEHGDMICQKLSCEIETSVTQLREVSTPGTHIYYIIRTVCLFIVR